MQNILHPTQPKFPEYNMFLMFSEYSFDSVLVTFLPVIDLLYPI